MAKRCEIRDKNGRLLDRGLCLFFPGPRSFTGEDVAELHIHGSRASVSAVLAALSDFEDYRLADPGEFTRRAFENGLMDLTAVEGLSDLIRAETETQRRQALDHADGSLARLYDGWAKRLTHARAMIEADIDFADEEDVPGSVADRIWPEIITLTKEIENHIDGARSGEIIRSGYRIVLIGAPNAGKSSLLNYLAQRDVAIVSEWAGTTRDVIEVRLDISGHLVLLSDTAGIRDSENPVELEGIRRSMSVADAANLVVEVKSLVDGGGGTLDGITKLADRVVVWTKSDLVEGPATELPVDGIVVSSKTGDGIDALIALISARIDELSDLRTATVPTRERHVVLLKTCLRELNMAVGDLQAPLEVRSEYLRSASHHLERITGASDVEHLLGVIFSEFCIGK